MSAIRLARAATGREPLLKFAGAYHGHVDGLLAEAGSGMATAGIPASPGVPAAATAGTVIVPWNDPDAVVAADARRTSSRRSSPSPIRRTWASSRRSPASWSSCASAPTPTARCSSSTRSSPASASRPAAPRSSPASLPDLTVMGKVIGGGLPAAAYGGSRELMERIAPAGDVYQAGTLSGNPLAVAAGLATLEMLDDAAYAQAGRHDRAPWPPGLREAAGDRPVQIQSACRAS